ncbi:hypothetical protein PG996_014074 [Apiospora saccharicola]|uniref:Methyltransferase type 11 domain-containing protein n=1 Tax=Apiospora saccharicola TaxID=335842 RepID=A0ABR1TJA8_9PEZI
MTSNTGDTTNFFHLADYDEAFWQNYLAARPKYDANGFYDQIYSYHDAHSARYDVAYDVGTGPGQVAGVLAARFKRVIASDKNEAHLTAAKKHHGHLPNIEFQLCSGEDMAEGVPAASCDIVVCAEAIPLMDHEKALDGFARALKPGGTLAVWFYGRPIFADGENRAACQEIYGRLFTAAAGKVIEAGGPAFREGWKAAADVIASELDAVAFPSETWRDVERRKWNTASGGGGGVMEFHGDLPGIPIRRPSRVDPEREKTTHIRDETFWAERWDVGQVRDFVRALLPAAGQAQLDEDPELQGMFAELAEAMGGQGAKRQIGWPVVLLLATRK